MSDLRFDGRVALVTGAGNGLGRTHALLLGARGAKVVVNDLGGGKHGDGQSSAAADAVVAEIKAAGGEAVANYDSVEDGEKIVKTALETFGKIDIVINNAGILRDTSFQKMTDADWDLVYRVHVRGAYKTTHAAWNLMRDQGYGRIIFTASAAGIYGNFGQANYAMAKLGLVGLSNTLALEGKKKNVLVNTIAPIAGSRLTETVLPKDLTDALKPEFVSPLVAYLAHDSCSETGSLFEVGGGFVGKLRWERTEGQLFKLSRPMTPEGVQKNWKKIIDFGRTAHPADITASMGPILGNLGTAKGQGGNEFIDVDEALGYEFPAVSSSYDERDLALYALGVGAAEDPTGKDLQSVYELHGDGFRPLPTYGVIPALNAVLQMAKEGKTAPGLNYGFDRILHGEQYTELKRPLPNHAKLTHVGKIKEIYDKGRHALVVTGITTRDEQGEVLAYNELTMLVRGAGGWGGERGPSQDANAAPEREPDAVVTQKIHENQALLYRLSGDWNPLHADPMFAQAFGFKKPILHGLCTFGYAARHVIETFAKDGDSRYFKSIRTRFSDSVFPGETLRTEMWKDGNKVIFRCKAVERGTVVISNAVIEFYDEIPSIKAKAKVEVVAKAAEADTGPIEPTTSDVFAVITHYVKEHPELAKQVGTIFQFRITSPESTWTVNLKDDAGSVTSGESAKPECTLELSEADFIAMSSGKADPQKLYFGGKLKISGNVMASQKLTFLQKIDPKAAAKIALEARGSKPAGAPIMSAPKSESGPTSGNIFNVIAGYVQKHPELATQVATVFQFKLSEPESAWVIDVKNGPGAVTSGEAAADCTLALSDADFVAMSTGKADAQKLYFSGKLKISGNVMASQKLDFLKKIDTTHVSAAAPVIASSAEATTPKPTKSANASRFFGHAQEALKANPGLAAEVAALVQINVKSPDSNWVLDLRGDGAIHQGSELSAAATLTLNDEDLLALGAEASTRELFQRGQLRVDGDVRLAHKLAFLKSS